MASDVCGSSAWNLLHVSLLACRILRWRLGFWKICASLFCKHLRPGVICSKISPLKRSGLCKGKGKTHPVTGHEGPEGEYMYRSTLSLTSALNEGE